MATIRETAINYIKTQLATITIANGYSRDLGTKRIYGVKETPSQVVPPAIIIMQGEEEVMNNIGERFSCELEIAIGFVDRDRTTNPDQDATTFMGEIQKVLPIEFDITMPIYPSGDSVPGTIVLMEVGNTINITAAVPGIIMGQVTYIMKYRRNIYDPNRF
jgi:hypothetical protein